MIKANKGVKWLQKKRQLKNQKLAQKNAPAKQQKRLVVKRKNAQQNLVVKKKQKKFINSLPLD